MKKNYVIYTLLFTLMFVTSCSGQPGFNTLKNDDPELEVTPETDLQIGEYVVEIFEDSKGNLWFGTMAEGVARYNPSASLSTEEKTLTYFSVKDGLAGNTVASIAEDKEGNIWFGTHSGLSRYSHSAAAGTGSGTFINFTTQDGLCHDRVSSILVDKAGNIWVGTWGGVCRYNGSTFSDFLVPVPDVELLPYQSTMDWVTEIIEDKEGNIWFGRDGYGACMYDGISFTHYTKKDGLASNNVQALQEDKQGNIWFGARVVEKDHPDADKRTGDGGLSRYYSLSSHKKSDKAIIQYPEIEALAKNDIYTIYEDKKGNIWIGVSGVGVYRYDGESFHIYKGTDRMDLTYNFGVQSIMEDKNGTLWFGFSGGLFCLDGTSFVNVTKNGLWE